MENDIILAIKRLELKKILKDELGRKLIRLQLEYDQVKLSPDCKAETLFDIQQALGEIVKKIEELK